MRDMPAAGGQDEGTTHRVTVRIFGEEYVLRGEARPAYMERLADMVDRRMNEIAKRHPRLGITRIAVLAAINLADELSKLEEQYQRVLSMLEREWDRRKRELNGRPGGPGPAGGAAGGVASTGGGSEGGPATGAAGGGSVPAGAAPAAAAAELGSGRSAPQGPAGGPVPRHGGGWAGRGTNAAPAGAPPAGDTPAGPRAGGPKGTSPDAVPPAGDAR